MKMAAIRAKNLANVRYLLNHPFRRLIHFAEAQERFMISRVAMLHDPISATNESMRGSADEVMRVFGTSSNVSCCGIHRSLDGALSSHRVPPPVSALAHVDDVLRRSEKATAAAAAGGMKRRGKGAANACQGTSAMEHGSIVHAQLELLVKCWRSSVSEVAGGAAASTDEIERRASALFESEVAIHAPKGCRRVDACVYEVLNMCATLDWVPLASEYTVFDAQNRIATAADLLCLERGSAALVLVELKTSRTLRAPSLASTSGGVCWNAPGLSRPLLLTDLAEHILQVLATRRLLEGWGVHVHRSVVMHVSPRDGTRVYEYPVADTPRLMGVLWDEIKAWRARDLAISVRRRRRAASRRAPAKRAPAKRAPTKRTPAKRAPAKRGTSRSPVRRPGNAVVAAALAAGGAGGAGGAGRTAQTKKPRKTARMGRAAIDLDW